MKVLAAALVTFALVSTAFAQPRQVPVPVVPKVERQMSNGNNVMFLKTTPCADKEILSEVFPQFHKFMFAGTATQDGPGTEVQICYIEYNDIVFVHYVLDGRQGRGRFPSNAFKPRVN